MAGRELFHLPEDRARRRYAQIAQIGGDRTGVDGQREPSGRAQRFELGRKRKCAVLLRPVQRLDAEPVAHEVERARGAVESREGEQAVRALKRAIDAEAGDRLDQHLRVGRAAEVDVELSRHLGPVIELAVVSDDDALVRAHHRLEATRGDVDDRQPAMAERETRGLIDPMPFAVGPAIADRISHCTDGLSQYRVGRAVRPPKSRDAAHGVYPRVRRLCRTAPSALLRHGTNRSELARDCAAENQSRSRRYNAARWTSSAARKRRESGGARPEA